MARYAIGDVQGCFDELRALAEKLRFNPERDELWFVGDLVNRGPQSREVLRWVKSLGEAAQTVLGNHDLHLLAVALGYRKSGSPGDTTEDVLAAPDREQLLGWLLERPMLLQVPATAGRSPSLVVHAGVLPVWTTPQAVGLAREVEEALRASPERFFSHLYGDLPDRWSEELQGPERLRFAVNVMTRMRYCTPDGRIDLKLKGPPDQAHDPWRPWFDIAPREPRAERIICGHWSALGLYMQTHVACLDTGCVWGQSLTAIDLDSDAKPVCVSCRT